MVTWSTPGRPGGAGSALPGDKSAGMTGSRTRWEMPSSTTWPGSVTSSGPTIPSTAPPAVAAVATGRPARPDRSPAAAVPSWPMRDLRGRGTCRPTACLFPTAKSIEQCGLTWPRCPVVAPARRLVNNAPQVAAGDDHVIPGQHPRAQGAAPIWITTPPLHLGADRSRHRSPSTSPTWWTTAVVRCPVSWRRPAPPERTLPNLVAPPTPLAKGEAWPATKP